MLLGMHRLHHLWDSLLMECNPYQATSNQRVSYYTESYFLEKTKMDQNNFGFTIDSSHTSNHNPLKSPFKLLKEQEQEAGAPGDYAIGS